MVTALCGSFCIACLRPLTRRYANIQISHSNQPIPQCLCLRLWM
ncbi:hypothetical protein K6U64_16780 [Vibrio vulnificus]|nr:hypothetical protein [Vibrio vulnificus]